MAIKNTISPWVGRDTFIQPHIIDESWPDKYNFILLDDVEELEYALNQTNGKLLAVDTETTGLDPEVDNIVGYSFSSDGRTGYYVPIRHKSGKNILPKKALDLLYEAMKKAKVVMMFNMRFDCRMFEYENWTSDYKSSRDPNDWGGYDMMNIKIFDTAQMMFLADTDNYANVSLKGAAAHIGIKMQTFEEVSGGVRFDYVDPMDGTYYAASDAIVTYKLGNGIGIKIYQEAKTAGMLDNDVLAVLMRCENEKTLIDKKLLYKLNNDVHDELSRIEYNMYNMAGYEFNLRSTVQVQDLFERMGIDTGYRTDTGKMSVGAKVIELLSDDVIEQYPFLTEYVRYKRLEKLRSSYIEVLNRWTDSGFNYVRVPYKTTNVSTGRLASGAGKNTKGSNFFTPSINIQNIPKQKSCDMYVIDLMDRDIFEEDLTLEIPRIIIMGYQLFKVRYDDEGDEIEWESIKYMYEEEISNPNYKYLGITESGSPNLNIRAMFKANDVDNVEEKRVFVSYDFSGQELRMAANLSKEPVWVETFNSGGDLHKTVALAMVGGDEKKYSKELRKMAKGMNFSMLYLATAQSYVGSIFNGKPMNLVQATKMVNDYKKGLPTLMSWQKKIIDNAVKTGTIREYFGRPRRVRHLVNGGKKSQAARNSANMIIQGSCASILKITLLKLWKKGMISPNEELRFLNTVHDEINYSAKFNSEADLYEKLKSIKETMTFKLPEWPVVFEVDGSIGNSFGIQLEIKLENGRILPKLK